MSPQPVPAPTGATDPLGQVRPAGLGRRQFLSTGLKAAALGAVGGPLLAACGGSSSPKGSSADDVITVGLPVFPKNFAQTTKYLAKFEKDSGIHVNLFTTNTAANTWVAVFQAISTRLAGGEPVDTANIATEGMLLFEERGALESLDSYIASDQAAVNAFYADVNPHMIANFRTLDQLKGHTYFLPTVYNVMSIWYNRSVFQQFKLPEPAPGWTWDDFEKAATTIAAAPNRYGYAISTPSPGPFIDVYPWVLTNGGQILNADQTQCVASNPAAIEAAAFVRSLVTKKLVNPPGGTYDEFSEIASGKLGMLGGGVWPNSDIPLAQSQINQQFGIAPWPRQAASGTPVGLAGFPMFKGSTKKAAVWEFIKYSLTDEYQSQVVSPLVGGVPIRTSIATSTDYLKTYPPGFENFTSELSYSTMIVGVPNGSAVENEIGTAWEQILTGSTSPSAGMAAMQTNVTQLMAQSV
jgi:multiple sugar transport system substrate-binding protein